MEQNLLGVGKTWAPVVAWMALIFTFSTDWFARPKPNGRSKAGKVIHVPIGTTQQMKMSCATFKATTENPPLAPFGKGGGPKDRGIFASNRHFHKSRSVATVIIATLYAISDEWRQSFVPSRGASAIDVAIDAFGAICGAFWTLCCGRTCAIADKAQQVVKKT